MPICTSLSSKLLRINLIKNILFCLVITTNLLAQPHDCDLGKVSDKTTPNYPVIARAAHITGMVIGIATFDRSGRVTEIRFIQGHEMLRSPTAEYVRGWHANEYSGTRNCPIVVNYLLDQKTTNSFERIDSQHVNVYGQTVILSDPSFVIEKRKRRFWLF